MKCKSTFPCWDWLFVLPLCDFLSGDIEQFATLEYRPTLVSAERANEFGYEELRKHSRFQPGYVCLLLLRSAARSYHMGFDPCS